MSRAWQAAAAYLFVTVVLTWPLARGIARDVPGELGEPLAAMRTLAWDGEQLREILSGRIRPVRTFFHARIFHPQPRALAYSDHLFAQAVQALPVYALTGNPILAYNLLFLSTFVLSGLGVFLLVRELTGHAWAAFLAGLLFAFAPYRLAHLSHLALLSAQWMPFALYGLRRYVATGRRRALAGGAAALVAQNLSSTDSLMYFPPFVALYVAWEIVARGLWTDRRKLVELAVVALVVMALTAPFVLPYARLLGSGALAAYPGAAARGAADVYSFVAGLLTPALALAGLAAWVVRAWRTRVDARPARVPAWLLASVAAIAIVYVGMAIATARAWRIDTEIAGVPLRATDVTRQAIVAAGAGIALLALSPRIRARAALAARESEAFFLFAVVAALWLSLGPSPLAARRPLDLWSPYALLSAAVPAYGIWPEPARFATIATLALAVMAGFGAAWIARRRRGRLVIALLAAGFVLDAREAAFPVNANATPPGFHAPPPRIYRPARAPRIYEAMARTQPDAVLLEAPFGVRAYDLRAVYYSTVHRRALVNGYGRFAPPHYSRLGALLRDPHRQGDLPWLALRAIDVTHVLVHEGAYIDDEGAAFSRWLREGGAAEVFRDGPDVLWLLPR